MRGGFFREQRKRKWHAESVLDLYNLLLATLLLISPWFLVRASEKATADLRISGAATLGFARTRAMHFGIGTVAAVAFLAAIELFLRHEAAERQSTPPRPQHQPQHPPA